MKKRILLPAVAIMLLLAGMSTKALAERLDGSTSLNKGHYMEGSTSAPGYHCEYSQYEVCVIYAYNGGGIDLDWYNEWLIFGKLRMVFKSPWGSTTCGFGHDTDLPSSIATQMGYPALHVVTGVYPVVVTAAYPNGYVDVDIAP